MKLLITILLALMIGCTNIDSGPTDTTVKLTFAHAGEDGILGIVARYDVRYTDDRSLPFNQWTVIPQVVIPKEPPHIDTLFFDITFPDDETMYYFAAKAVDDANHWSLLHPIDSFYIDDITPPSNVVLKILEIIQR